MHRRIAALAAALALGVGLWAPPARAAEPPAGPATLTIDVAPRDGGLLDLSGRLTASDGSPVPGATVHLAFDGAEFAAVQTRADGGWAQRVDPEGALSSGTHTFTATFAGLGRIGPASAARAVVQAAAAPPSTAPPPPATTAPPSPAGPVATQLSATFAPAELRSLGQVVVSGMLADAAGNPVPGARIKAGVAPAAQDTTAITGPDGRFSFSLVLPDAGATPRPVSIVLAFDGEPGLLGSTFTMGGTLAPSAGPTPAPSPTPSAPPTPSTRPTPTATPTPVLATPSAAPVTPAPFGGIPGLGTIVGILGVALASRVAIGVAAFAWHRRDLRSS